MSKFSWAWAALAVVGISYSFQVDAQSRMERGNRTTSRVASSEHQSTFVKASVRGQFHRRHSEGKAPRGQASRTNRRDLRNQAIPVIRAGQRSNR